MKIIFFVPIKTKSSRLPNKMFLKLGKDLLCQKVFNTLIELKTKMQELGYHIEIYCYCSEPKIMDHLSDEIKYLSRPSHLDSDETKGIDIYLEFIKHIDADIYGLVHATSPFISCKSMIEGLIPVINGVNDSSFSVSKIQTFCWFKGKPLNYNLTNIPQTQMMTPVFYETSAFYIFQKHIISPHNRRIGFNPLQIQTNRIESIDIDEQSDYDLCCAIVNK